jgi:Kef-type K+ transport system membrane component KefB
MATDNMLLQTFVYLAAAVIAVPVAKRLGLGSVLGYLIAGVIVGPHALRLAGDVQDAMHFAEFGVVMMLFLIGLELRPSVLWELRGSIFGLGGAQVSVTALAAAGIAMVFGLTWQVGLAAGVILAMSSTAIILQSLQEKGLMNTPGGQASFSILLFQDIAVIPILALLPLLAPVAAAPEKHAAPPAAEMHATEGHAAAEDHHAAASLSIVDGLEPWQRGLVTIGVVGLIAFGAGRVLRPMFYMLAMTRLREIFTAMALLLVVGISLLMQMVGLSPALGAFLAGVVLAESEYRHQLEADIEPFKGLLLGLFFITVGASLDLPLVGRQPGLILALVAGLIVVKLALLLGLAKLFRMEWSQALLVAISLAQGGEFAFVLLNFATNNHVLPAETAGLLNASVALSMAIAPILFTLNTQFIQPRFANRGSTRQPDEIHEHDNPVILAGFGRFGHVVGRLLRGSGYGVTVLDNDADQVDVLRKFGLKSYYGDASREDMLRLAGAERAKLLILAIDNEGKAVEIVKTVQEHFPHLQIIARAESRADAMDLIRLGVSKVHRVTLGSALDLGIDALRALGMPAKQAHRSARIFKERDEASVRDIAALGDIDDEVYASRARIHIQNLDELLKRDAANGGIGAFPDEAWLRPGAKDPE